MNNGSDRGLTDTDKQRYHKLAKPADLIDDRSNHFNSDQHKQRDAFKKIAKLSPASQALTGSVVRSAGLRLA